MTNRTRASLLDEQNQFLRDLARGKSLDELLAKLVMIYEQTWPASICSVLLLDALGKHLHHGAGPSLPREYIDFVDGIAIGPSVGSCGTAAFENRLVVVENIQHDSLWADYREHAARHNLKACWSQPICSSHGTVLGTFAVYYPDPRSPSDDELELVDDLVQLAAIAIEHKRREVELEKSNERFRSLVRNAPACIGEIDINGRFTGINRIGVQAFARGYKKHHEIVGANWVDVVRQQDKSRVETLFKRAFEGHETKFEFTSDSDLGSRDYLASFSPIRDEDGLTEKVVFLATDITSRRAAEIKLRQSEEQLRNVLDSVPAFILTLSLDGSLLYINRTQPGFDRHDVLGTSMYDFIHPDDQQTVRDAFEKVVTLRQDINCEHRGAGPNGEMAWYSARYGPIEKDGRLIAVSGIATDITNLKRAENELRESEHRFRMLAEHVRLIPWEADAKSWEFTYVGPQAKEILGYPVERWFEPDFWRHTIHPEDRDWAIEFGEKCSAGRHDYKFEYRMIAADDRIVWMHDVVNVVRDENGPVMLRGFLIDVTEQKEMAEKLRQRDLELAHVSRLTTMGEMAAELAHEINQPLYAIANYAEACMGAVANVDNDELDDFVRWTRHISEQANRAGGIIRRINRFLRKSPPEFECTDINHLIRETVELVDVECRSHDVHVRLDLFMTLPSVFADTVLLQQVMINLMRNGIDAMRDIADRERVLIVRTAEFDKHLIQVDVTDVGHGIDPDSQAAIFNSFYSTKPDGLGLGLTICRSAIESHQGKLWSIKGDKFGTTFRFILPIYSHSPMTVGPPAKGLAKVSGQSSV